MVRAAPLVEVSTISLRLPRSIRERGRDAMNRGSFPKASNNVRHFFFQLGAEDDELVYTVKGSGFLHHMVRNLVGTFILVGKGTLRARLISTRILGARSRSAAGATAPAHGLYLVNVEY